MIPSLEGKKWLKFSGGLHHTLGLTTDGKKTKKRQSTIEKNLV